MRRLLLAGLLGGLAAFAWGFVSWMVLPWHFMTWSAFAEDRPVMAALAEQAKGDGAYFLPTYPELRGDSSPEALEEMHARMEEGPRAFVIWNSGPAHMSSPRPYLIGLLIDIAVATVSAGLLALAAGRLAGYGQRVVFVSCLGVIAALNARLTDWNWMEHPLPFAAVNALDLVVEAILVGLVLAALIKGPPRGN